ncbi:hypothetical protein FE257_003702 [Aspergillus nanangensis]|uniref:Zn(2)-C6 fungal-type domain-containing protein n=1 Tax=Aspergillus nanangensis TaxID=2582783 RepID=A0AAD4CS51_ASPNN|nr:hypothetical protein FE257_003702 [Aspergillus nanangensis]
MTRIISGVDPHEARRTRSAKSMSYTGCWTCRKRRVKCDERPVACRVCEKASLTCAGYGLRLIWNAGENGKLEKPPHMGRRRINPDKNNCQPMTERQVQQAITTIDNSAANPASTTIGPFSVFCIESDSHVYTADAEPQSVQSAEQSSTQDTVDSCNESLVVHQDDDSPEFLSPSPLTNTDNPPNLCDPLFTTAWDAGTNSLGPLTDLTGDSILHPELEITGLVTQSFHPESLTSSYHDIINNQLGISSSSEETRPLEPHDSHSPFQYDSPSQTTRIFSPETSSLVAGPLSFGHNLTASLIRTTTATMLMDHYTQDVVHLMQPVFHPRNPFRTIYLPVAIKGLSEIEATTTCGRVHPASITVFHSLLSAAAVSLQSRQSGADALRDLACHHRQRALITLRSALETQSSSYKDLMTAILSLVSADIMNGGTSDHWIHLEAGVQLQASRHYARLVSQETRILNSICRMLLLFAQTTVAQPKPKRWSESDTWPNEIDFYFLEPSVEFLYGITPSIAKAIFRIHQLTQHLTYYTDKEYPSGLIDACETLGDELSSWSIASEKFSTMDSKKGNMLRIAHCQAKAFYYAARIYYYRSVQKCSRECLSLEQNATISAMNEAEDLKVSLDLNTNFPAPITWPAFIASCEAVGENRWLWDQWWSRVQTYKMGNYRRQQSAVRDIWARLDDSDTSIDWREALVEMNLRIIPV